MKQYTFENHIDLLNQNIEYKSSKYQELLFYNRTVRKHVQFLYRYQMFFLLLDFLNVTDSTEECAYSIFNINSKIMDTEDKLISAIKSGTIKSFYPDSKSIKIKGILNELVCSASLFIDENDLSYSSESEKIDEFRTSIKTEFVELQEIFNESHKNVFE